MPAGVTPPPHLAIAAAAILLLLLPAPAGSTAADPDPATIQPLHLSPSPPATIPAFPEQSAVAGCPLDLPDDLFHALHSACGGELRRARCCPVLAAWLYSAYSTTALGRQAAAAGPALHGHGSPAYDLPLLPDDSETCVDGLGKALKERGVELSQPNETCDVVYCYCGIRLHPLSCPDAFSVGSDGKLHGNDNVRRLETDCINGGSNRNGCSKCLHSLHLLTHNTSDPSKSKDRTTKMHNKDCHLMGLTWLLSKDRTAYIHTVSNILRVIMMSPEASDPHSCTLSSDGLPLAVDSAEISGSSSSQFVIRSSICFILFVLCYGLVVAL